MPKQRTRVQVGRSWQRRFNVRTRHHVVVPEGQPGYWNLLCSGSKATREYEGFLETAVTCPACLRKAAS